DPSATLRRPSAPGSHPSSSGGSCGCHAPGRGPASTASPRRRAIRRGCGTRLGSCCLRSWVDGLQELRVVVLVAPVPQVSRQESEGDLLVPFCQFEIPIVRPLNLGTFRLDLTRA